MLEEQILNQLNVVFMDQVFPLFVGDGTLVRLKVTAITPPPPSSGCAQLKRDISEISVAPKVRKVKESEVTAAHQKPKVTSALLRVQSAPLASPGVALVNPLTLKKLVWDADDQMLFISALMKPPPVGKAGKDHEKAVSSQAGGERSGSGGKGVARSPGGGIACVIRADASVREGHIGLDDLARKQCGAWLHSRTSCTLLPVAAKPFPSKVTLRAVRWLPLEAYVMPPPRISLYLSMALCFLALTRSHTYTH